MVRKTRNVVDTVTGIYAWDVDLDVQPQILKLLWEQHDQLKQLRDSETNYLEYLKRQNPTASPLSGEDLTAAHKLFIAEYDKNKIFKDSVTKAPTEFYSSDFTPTGFQSYANCLSVATATLATKTAAVQFDKTRTVVGFVQDLMLFTAFGASCVFIYDKIKNKN